MTWIKSLNSKWKARLGEILIDLQNNQVRVPEEIGKKLEKEINDCNSA